ncbi:hypothetical protein TSAR_011233, partial [Trichomalopsis sarcophagae]
IGSVKSSTKLKLSIFVTSGYKFKPTAAARQYRLDPHAPDDQVCSIATAAGTQRQDT